ncbi:MAG: MoaD/ThiS family protein [Anaerolineales bacterium]|jgi:sulfur carrier protein ThiS
MPISIKLRDTVYEVRAGMTARDALKKINVLPETVLITRNGELITDDEILTDGEEIRLIAVISGGSNRG